MNSIQIIEIVSGIILLGCLLLLELALIGTAIAEKGGLVVIIVIILYCLAVFIPLFLSFLMVIK